MLQTLAILEAAGLSPDQSNDVDPTSAEFVHLVTETAKLAFADREAWYGDPKFTDVPAETLLSKAYAQSRANEVSDTASMDLRPGRPRRPQPEFGCSSERRR